MYMYDDLDEWSPEFELIFCLVRTGPTCDRHPPVGLTLIDLA